MRFAHVTDLHLVEPGFERRRGLDGMRLRYLNAGRRIAPQQRQVHALNALRAAGRADHVVVTGDLTEDGHVAQFEILADLLQAAGLAPERVTLIPGNHDLYAGPDAFARALCGPLSAYARTSSPGAAVDFGSVLLLPISTAVHQHFMRSAGVLRPEDALQIKRLAPRPATLLVAQHHPPAAHPVPMLNWLDGIDSARASTALLRSHERLHVLHGHLHAHRSRVVSPRRREQVHCAGAALKGAEQVRFYEAGPHGLIPLDPGAVAAPQIAARPGEIPI